MPIALSCPKGHRLQVKDEFAGKKAKCPKCGAIMLVPAPAGPDASPSSQVADQKRNADDDPGYVIVDDPGCSVVHDDQVASGNGGEEAQFIADDVPIPLQTGPELEAAPRLRHAAEQGVGAVPARRTTLTSSEQDTRTNIFWIGSGGLAGFCSVLVLGIGLMFLLRDRSSPSVQKTTEPLATAPPATAKEQPPGPSAGPAPPNIETEFAAKTVSAHVRLFTFTFVASAYAYDPKTARIAIHRGDVANFIEVGEKLKPLRMDKPNWNVDLRIALRQAGEKRYFIGTSRDPRAIQFVDADSLELVKSLTEAEFPIGELVPESFSGSSKVYFRSARNGNEEGLACVDVRTLEIDRASFVGGVSRYAIQPLPLSDGRQCVDFGRDRRTRNSPVRVWLLGSTGTNRQTSIQVKSITPTDPPLTNTERDTQNSPRFRGGENFIGPPPLPATWVPLPFANRVILADLLIKPDEMRLEGTLPFKALLHWPNSPWVFGFVDGSLAAASLNGLQERKRVDLGWNGSEPTSMFADVPHQRIIVCGDTQFATVSLAAFGLPSEPVLFSTRQPEPVVQVGRPLDFDLKPATAGVELKLVGGPPGMSLDGSRLKWQPKLDDCGMRQVEIEYRHGNLSRRENWFHEVRPRFAKLPFSISRISVSADGRRAVAWGIDGESKIPKHQLALVDLSTLTVVSQRAIDDGIQDAEVGESGVYVYGSRSLQRLSLDDLSTIAEKSMEGGAERLKDAIYLVADRFGFAPLAQQRLELPSLRELEKPRGKWQHQAGRICDGWLWDGAIWDGAMQKPQWLISLPGFAGSEVQVLDQEEQNRMLQDFQDHRFHWDKRGYTALSEKEGIPDAPVVVEYKPESATLVLKSIYDSKKSAAILLQPSMPDHGKKETRKANYIDSGRGVIAVALGNNLYVLPLDEFPPDLMAGRPPIELRQSTLLLNLAAQELTYEVAPDVTHVELTLPGKQQRSFRLERGEGLIPLDGLDEYATEVLLAAIKTGSPGQPPFGSINNYIASVESQFEKLVGTPPQGAPCAVPVKLSVHRTGVAPHLVSHYFLVDLPKSFLVKEAPVAPRSPAAAGKDNSSDEKKGLPTTSSDGKTASKTPKKSQTAEAGEIVKLGSDSDGEMLSPADLLADGKPIKAGQEVEFVGRVYGMTKGSRIQLASRESEPGKRGPINECMFKKGFVLEDADSIETNGTTKVTVTGKVGYYEAAGVRKVRMVECEVEVMGEQPKRSTAKETGAKGGPHELIGEWRFVSIDERGTKNVIPDGIAVTITENRWIMTVAGQNAKELKIQVDSTKRPKWIDMVEGKTTALGIYELDGENLRIRLGDDNSGKRPTSFESKVNLENEVVMVLERISGGSNAKKPDR